MGDRLKLRIDPNQGYAPEVAFPLARDLEKFNLEYLEQPMPAPMIGEAARLRKYTKTPIGLNEVVTTPEVVLQLLTRILTTVRHRQIGISFCGHGMIGNFASDPSR